jgi:hypothetical protein
MAAICHGVGAREAHDIAHEASYLLGAVRIVLADISWIDSPRGASAKAIVQAVNKVSENHDNLARIYGGWLDQEWTKAAVGGNAKCFDFADQYGMTAIQACFAASSVVLNASADHLHDGAESPTADVARFVAEVRAGLAGITPQEIEGHLWREYAIVEGTAETRVRGESAADDSPATDDGGNRGGLKPKDGNAHENAYDAHRKKLFPIDGKPTIDVRDAIVKLDTCRDGKKSDMDILREFTGETKDDCPKAKLLPAKIRAARDRGETTLPAAR